VPGDSSTRSKERLLHAAATDLATEAYRNSKLFKALREHGDKLDDERDVRHWAYFETQGGRNLFREAIEAAGFRVVYEHGPKGQIKQWAICFDRAERMAEAGLTRVCADLSATARSFGGEYDGWETELRADG